MNFQDVEQRFGQLRAARDAGSLSEPDFDREREQLKTRDERGVWWTKGRTGDWYFHDGTMWVPGHPQLMGGHPSGPMPAATAYPGQVQQGQGNAGLMIGLGIACAVVSLFFLPIVLGPLGIFFGYRAQKEGNASGGRNVMIASGVCGALGLIFALVLLVASSS